MDHVANSFAAELCNVRHPSNKHLRTKKKILFTLSIDFGRTPCVSKVDGLDVQIEGLWRSNSQEIGYGCNVSCADTAGR